MPRIPALRRRAPSVRFIFFAISVSGARAFEYALSLRMSSVVHGVLRPVSFCATNRMLVRVEKVPAPGCGQARGKPARAGGHHNAPVMRDITPRHRDVNYLASRKP